MTYFEKITSDVDILAEEWSRFQGTAIEDVLRDVLDRIEEHQGSIAKDSYEYLRSLISMKIAENRMTESIDRDVIKEFMMEQVFEPKECCDVD